MATSAKTSAGYNSQKGTAANKVPEIMKAEGVKATNMPNKPENIQAALKEGKGVVSSHDAGKLWGNNAQGGHAVHVTGVKRGPDGKITEYIINDTGTGQVGRRVPAAQFEGSLLKAPATVTEKPISYGGSTAKAQRRTEAKAQKTTAAQAETTPKLETTTAPKKAEDGKNLTANDKIENQPINVNSPSKKQDLPEAPRNKTPKLSENLVSEPKSIWGKSAEEIKTDFENSGYGATVKQSTKGSKKSIQIRIEGHPEITNIQVHPGGGLHGGSYYKISTSTKGKIKVVDPDTYKPTEGEKTEIIFMDKKKSEDGE